MARLNELNKLIVFPVAVIIGGIGVVVFALSLYVIFANWGNLNPAFFLGIGIAGAMFGMCLIFYCMIGRLAVRYQDLKTGI